MEDDLLDKINDLNGEINDLNGEISRLEDEIYNLEIAVSGLEDEVMELQTDLSESQEYEISFMNALNDGRPSMHTSLLDLIGKYCNHNCIETTTDSYYISFYNELVENFKYWRD